jgi:hypothetical protein
LLCTPPRATKGNQHGSEEEPILTNPPTPEVESTFAIIRASPRLFKWGAIVSDDRLHRPPDHCLAREAREDRGPEGNGAWARRAAPQFLKL